MENNINEIISTSLDFNDTDLILNEAVLLFGAGSAGEMLINKLRDESHIHILNIFDNDDKKINSYCGNMPIQPAKTITKYDKSTPIIICSMYFAEIASQLSNLGFKKIYDYHFFLFPQTKVYFDKNLIENNQNQINKLFEILEDDLSKETFLALLEYRLKREYHKLKNVTSRTQYFVEDIINLEQNEIFIDAGGYNGQISLEFIKRCPNYSSIYIFEPSKENLNLAHYNLRNFKNIHFISKGLSDKNEILKFDTDLGPASSISENGTVEIEVVSLDTLVNKKVTFIKMDIEGAEIAALMGSENLIKLFKPKLAISVYHAPTDLWEIPLLIKRLNPDYKIYLRNHSGTIAETVCYAIQ